MSENELEILRHSVAHIMAQAVCDLFPGIKLTIGPSIEDGFYYDFDAKEPFKPEDLENIETRMKKIIKEDLPFKHSIISKRDAYDFFKKRNETYKLELLDDIEEDNVTIYEQGTFLDLCKGPHIKSTGKVRAFKLLSIAGSYWRGDEKNKMLQRIYGTAFYSKSELDNYLKRLEDAKKSDHRRLGKELGLFSIDEEIGPGLICWHPRGAVVRCIIEDFWRKEHYKAGYQIVYSPHIAKADLWHTSGHWDFYRENIYSPMDVEGSEYIIKPMNCPFHIKIYKNKMRSYRDLPIRWAELGTVYRYERSGVLHGLFRVRGFTQDDAHIFCRLDQLEKEIKTVLEFTLYMLKSFGFAEYNIFLSTRPEKYVGNIKDWGKATDALKSAVENLNLSFQTDPGEGVFYGPKIDVKIKDSLGRSWQCSTIQVDFNLPERFNIYYIGEDGTQHRPIMIHRALMGSLERFFGCLIEHYRGAFPLWLAPVQIVVIPITDRQKDYSQEITSLLRENNFRVEIDLRNEKMGYKIREAQLMKVPYMIIIGNCEVESGTVSIRKRDGSTADSVNIKEFIEKTKEEVNIN